jgi:ubiquinone/menaquinone biosynthesis C-methylase UbiE
MVSESATAPAVIKSPISASERAAYRPQSLDACLDYVRGYFDSYAPLRERWRSSNAGYHSEITRLFTFYVQPNAAVLEIGCGNGDLLAALKPSRGVGVDLSPAMIDLAKKTYPQLTFYDGAFETLPPLLGDKFDYIVMSDLLPFVYDIQALFEKLKPYCHSRTRLVMHTHSRLWQPILRTAEILSLKYPQPTLNWVNTEDITNFLNLTGFEVVSTDSSAQAAAECVQRPCAVPLFFADELGRRAPAAGPAARHAGEKTTQRHRRDSLPQRSGKHPGRNRAPAAHGQPHRSHFR